MRLGNNQLAWLRTHMKGFAEREKIAEAVKAETREYRKLLTTNKRERIYD